MLDDRAARVRVEGDGAVRGGEAGGRASAEAVLLDADLVGQRHALALDEAAVVAVLGAGVAVLTVEAGEGDRGLGDGGGDGHGHGRQGRGGRAGGGGDADAGAGAGVADAARAGGRVGGDGGGDDGHLAGREGAFRLVEGPAPLVGEGGDGRGLGDGASGQ